MKKICSRLSTTLLMKKSTLFFSTLFLLFCLSFNSLHAQDRIIGEKGREAVIGEKGVVNPQINKAAMAKMKNELEKYYADYQKKQAASESAAATLRKKIEEAMKDLEANNKISNFEIQQLMSEYNQAETLASQVLKKREETKKKVVSKL